MIEARSVTKTYSNGPEQGEAVKYAEALQICEYGRRPSAEQIRQLFPFFPKP